VYKRQLEKGDPLGTVWGDEIWGNLHFAVIKSDNVPRLKDCNSNIVNCFPQVFQLYYKQFLGRSKYFSKGMILFGKNRLKNGNEKNASAFEPYLGKGWIFGKWNVADKVENVVRGEDGNVRLQKTLFKNQAGECTNPENWYEYEISVTSGIYRIRAKVGDVFLPTWQKVSFESVDAGIFENRAGEFKWTSERVVRVNDGKLSIRIYIDESGEKTSGLSEIVFQKAG
jgi:hypothetical protein